jgi:hypothetical protein
MKVFTHLLSGHEWRKLHSALFTGSLIGFAGFDCVGQQAVRVVATPYRVNEGDSVQFRYLEATNTFPRSAVHSFAWDFNGDGVVDLQGTNHSPYWTATYEPTRATNLIQWVLPRLEVTLTNGQRHSVTGITEAVTFTPALDRYLQIVSKASGNPDLTANFTANPRLTIVGTAVRFAADVQLRKPGKVERVEWNFGSGAQGSGSSVQHSFAALGQQDVVMTVFYQLQDENGAYTGITNQLSRTNLAFVSVVPAGGDLSLGRAYRRGFPSELGWEDIIKAYSTPSASGDTYSYYRYLTNAFRTNTFLANPANGGDVATGRQLLAETVNELLQGQILVANQRLIEALRIKYPRVADLDPANPPPKLPEPPGAREETRAIEVSLLDYQAALWWALKAVGDFGVDLLRSRAEPGREPFPEFPAYLEVRDPSLSPQPVPIKNEYWQLTTAFDRVAFGSVEKGRKLFNLSVADTTARSEAKEACKQAGIAGYLGMALLAAGQSTNDFALNQGNQLLSQVKNARDLFEGINGGLNPLRNNGEFIPNESFGNIYAAAQEAVSDARSAEIDMRQETREFDRRKAELRSELQSQRAQFITPLKNLTGLDPASYNNLATVADQIDYRNTVNQRVNALLAAYPNADPRGLGEYGAQVIAVLDSGEAIKQAIGRLQNLYEAIKIAEWANTEIDNVNDDATSKLQAIAVVKGLAQSCEFTTGTTGSGFTFRPGAIVAGFLEAGELDIRRIQNLRISNIQLEEQVRKSLLEVGNLQIDVRRSMNHFDQENLRLDSMLSLMDRYIEDLAHARLTAENLYFQDPSFRVVVSSAQRRADGELDFAIDRLFRLAKTLEYEWTEPYQNPVTVPIGSQEPPSLENPLFDKFTSLESLFVVRSADESKDYLDALRAWNSKLRRINVASVRGPNHAGPISAEPISVRENVLNLKTRGPGAMPLDRSIGAFRDYLRAHLTTNTFNTGNQSLEFTFATSIADNSMFPATGSRWNMRIATVQVDLLADSGFNTKQVAEVDLIESGMATLRRYWAEPPLADDLFNLTFNIGTRSDRTAFGIALPARINGANGGRPVSEFSVAGLAGRPIAATRWVLRIDTENPSNRDIDFSRLKDIVIRFTYTYGNPPEYAGF